MLINLKIEGNPPRATAQEKGVRIIYSGGKAMPHYFTKKAVLEAKRYYMESLIPFAEQLKKEGSIPLRGPVGLEVRYTFTGKGHKENEWKITKPDTDNMIKLLKDCMTDVGIWDDDAQVCMEVVSKRWSTDAGCIIRVWQVN